MSALFTKDPESGVYLANEPARRWPVWLLAVPATLGIVALALASPRARASAPRVVAAPIPVKRGFDPSRAPASLRGAMELYKTRGGHYSLGHNDCSTFLLDYLAGHGIRSANRQTTATLVEPVVAQHFHLIPMTELDLSRPTDQSVVVLRYRGRSGELVGHCAVRLFQDGDVYFVHNAEHGGLVVDDQATFYGRFDRASVRDVRYYRFEGGF